MQFVPAKDRGGHLAQCQAFAISRSVKARQWQCLKTISGAGLLLLPMAWWNSSAIDFERDDIKPEVKGILKWTKELADALPSFPTNKYIGVVSAPLTTAGVYT